MYFLLLLVLVELSSQQVHIPENTYETCSLKLDRGDALCPQANSAIRFYFDAELEQCYSYLYEGCEGGRNTFYTEQECHFTCIPADKFTCGGNKKPTGSCHSLNLTCPTGSSCKNGFGGGLCCDDANEKEWRSEINPVCRTGNVLMRTVWYGSIPWIGRSCAHRFCPSTHDCIQGKRVAHCCGPMPNLIEEGHQVTNNTSITRKKKTKKPNFKPDNLSLNSSKNN